MKEIGRTRSGLQMGYTTGSCAAAAAKAAAEMLLSGEEIRQVRLLTPKGIELYLELEEIMRKMSEVSCAVRKIQWRRSGCDEWNTCLCNSSKGREEE